MKFEKLLDFHVLTGIAIGLLVGLYYPVQVPKVVLVIAAGFMALKVVGAIK